MPSYKYNPNNTEGVYPTSIDFIDTEIKKGDKIVATDLVDLYDTYPESQTPNQGDALVYDSSDGIWKPKEGSSGSSCNIIEGYEQYIPRDWQERDIINDNYSYYEGFAYGVYNEKIYMIGGRSYNPRRELNEYDPKTNTTKVISICPFIEKSSMFFTMSVVSNNIYLFIRAYNNSEVEVTSIWVYNFDDSTWQEKTYNHSFGYLYIVPGISQSLGQYIYLFAKDRNNVYQYPWLHKYDTTQNTWELLSNIPFDNPVSGFTTALHNDKFYVYGGTTNYSYYYDDLFEYDITNSTWSIITSGGKLGRYHLMDFVGDDLYIFGGGEWTGSGDTPSNDIMVYEFDNDLWYKIEGHDVEPRMHGGMSVINDYNLFFYGGGNIRDWGYFGTIIINSLFIDENTSTPGLGQYDTPFQTLKSCFEWLNKCKTIPDEIIITIQLLSDVTNTESTSLNHPQGYNIIINGNGFKIINKHNIESLNTTIDVVTDNLHLTNSSSESLFNNHIYSTGQSQLNIKSNVFRILSENNSIHNTSYIFNSIYDYNAIIDGELYSKGENNNSILGLGHDSEVFSYTYVDVDNVKEMSSNEAKRGTIDDSQTILKYDGTLWSSGSYKKHGIKYINTSNDIYFSSMWNDQYNNTFKKVLVDTESSIAINNEGKVLVTGRNNSGKLGIIGMNYINNYIEVPNIGDGFDDCCYGYTQYSQGGLCYFIMRSGQVYGAGLYVGLGYSTQTDEFTLIPELSNIKTGDIEQQGEMFIKNDSSIWWYNGNSGISSSNYRFIQINIYNTGTYPSESNYQWIDSAIFYTSSGSPNIYNLCVKNDGSIWKFERDSYGTNNFNFTLLNNSKNIRSLIFNGYCLCSNNMLWKFSPISNSFTQIGTDNNYQKIFSHGMALKLNGDFGRITSSGNFEKMEFKGYVFDDLNAISLSSCYENYMLTTDNGSVFFNSIPGDCYGGVLPDYDTYIKIPYYNSIHSINRYTFIKNDGTAWGFGLKEYFGRNNDEKWDRYLYNLINTDTDWELCTTGNDPVNNSNGGYFFGIKTDGTMWCAGKNDYGQLGLGDNIDRYNNIVQVGSDNDWISVSCGYLTTIALKSNGTIYVSGKNDYGQLGLGDNTDRNVFTQVGTDNDWKFIINRYNRTMVIKANGNVWGAGYNGNTSYGTRSLLGIGSDYQNVRYNYLIKSLMGIRIVDESVVNKYMTISNNHSIKKIMDTTLEMDISFTNEEPDFIYNIYNISVYSLSELEVQNVDIITFDHGYIINKSIIISDKSVLSGDLINTDKIMISDSMLNTNDIDKNVEWDLWNNSTLIIGKIPNIYPTIDNYESTYIIDGVLQP